MLSPFHPLKRFSSPNNNPPANLVPRSVSPFIREKNGCRSNLARVFPLPPAGEESCLSRFRPMRKRPLRLSDTLFSGKYPMIASLLNWFSSGKKDPRPRGTRKGVRRLVCDFDGFPLVEFWPFSYPSFPSSHYTIGEIFLTCSFLRLVSPVTYRTPGGPSPFCFSGFHPPGEEYRLLRVVGGS